MLTMPRRSRRALAKVMASPALVELQAEQSDESGRVVEPARYSTREMVAIERGMADSADRMAEGRGFGCSPVIAWKRARSSGARSLPGRRSSGRRCAHVTGQERIAAVVGLAGAGKSTMLAAAREAWERRVLRCMARRCPARRRRGWRNLRHCSRTLASWEHGWESGREALGSRDYSVIDEAGMVGVEAVGAVCRRGGPRPERKLVLVGDPEQLQPISAGRGVPGGSGAGRLCRA